MNPRIETLTMPELEVRRLEAKFSTFRCPRTERSPTVVDYTALSIPGSVHRFLDLESGKGITVEQGLDGIVEEARIIKAVGRRPGEYEGRRHPTILGRYPFNLKYHEWISAVMAYHWSTHLGEGKYILSGWKPVFSLIDLKNESFHNYTFESSVPTLHSARTHWDERSRSLYFCQYDSQGMFDASFVDSGADSFCRICRFDIDTNALDIVWQGRMKGFVDDVRINATGEYLVACSFTPGHGDRIGYSRNLVLNLLTDQHWFTDEIATPAHCDFDLDEPDVVYCSEHNFRTQEVDGLGLVRHLVTKVVNQRVKVGIVSPIGPARIIKYRLTGDGPVMIAETTHEQFNRSVSNWNFMYRGEHLVCAPSGDPTSICLFHAEDLSLYRAYEVPEPIFTLIPSRDGEHVFAIAAKTKSVYVLETGTGAVVGKWNPNTYRYLHHSFHVGRVDDLSL